MQTFVQTYGGGSTLLVVARTPSTLSTKNSASLSALVSVEADPAQD